MATERWAVEIKVDGERVLGIEDDYLAGIDSSDPRWASIQTATEHLVSFLGGSLGKVCPCCHKIKPFDDVKWRVNPFQSEIYDNEEEQEMCSDCEDDYRGDI